MSKFMSLPTDKLHVPDLIILRFVMVLGGMSPVFILWAIRGTCLFSDTWFRVVCGLIVILPNVLLLVVVNIARGAESGGLLEVGTFEDRKDGVLVYLVSILLPFYSSSFDSWSDLISTIAAIVFILFIFMYLDLHYVNIFFALAGFKIFFINPLEHDSGLSSRQSVILITKSSGLRVGDKFHTSRLTNRIQVERRS